MGFSRFVFLKKTNDIHWMICDVSINSEMLNMMERDQIEGKYKSSPYIISCREVASPMTIWVGAKGVAHEKRKVENVAMADEGAVVSAMDNGIRSSIIRGCKRVVCWRGREKWGKDKSSPYIIPQWRLNPQNPTSIVGFG